MSGEGTGYDWLNTFFGTRDERALAQAVQHYLGLVYGTAWRQLSDAGQAEEVAQNVFIALARRTLPFASPAAAAGWLYQTTLLQARQRLRSEYRRQRREAAAIALGTTMKEEDPQWQKLLPLLDEAMARLREPERQAVLLRFFQDKSLREVGAALGVSEDAAQKRVAACLDKISRYFQQAGYRVSVLSLFAAAAAQTTAAVPAGLASGLAKTAILQAGAVPLAGWSGWILKLMGLTKTQTAALCLVLGAAPLAYQGTLDNKERRLGTLLAAQVAASADALATTRAERDALTRRNQQLQEQLERLRRLRAGPASIPAPAAEESAWSDQSPVIAVPRHLLDQIGIPAIGEDGQLTEDMARVLGLDEPRTSEVNQMLGQFSARYTALEAERMRPTTEHPSSMRLSPVKDRRSFVCEAFPEAYQPLLEELQSRLAAQLGEAGSAYFWKNARESSRHEFDPDKAGRAKRVVLFRPEKEQPGGGPYMIGEEYQYENGSWGSAMMQTIESESKVSSPMVRSVIAEWRQSAEKR